MSRTKLRRTLDTALLVAELLAVLLAVLTALPAAISVIQSIPLWVAATIVEGITLMIITYAVVKPHDSDDDSDDYSEA